jgi:ribonuclease R
MMPVGEEELLKLVRSKKYRPATVDELAERLSVSGADREEFSALLEEMQRQGLIVRVKKQWVDPLKAGLIVGRLQCNPRGFGFLVPAAEDEGEDVYVAEEDMGEAMDDDLVVVELHRRQTRGRRGRKLGPSGRVIKVIEHRNRELIGTFKPGQKFGRVVPDNPRLFRDVYVAKEDSLDAKEDDLVVVEVTAWPSLRRNPEGVVRNVLGKAGDPGVDVQSVILEFGLPREFPAAVDQAAEQITASLPKSELARRRDLRQYTTVTIDPEDAKDFDDALSFYRDPKTDRPVVLVHIADISYYIAPDGELDVEARSRGNSVYLANEVVPMFPHKLSKQVMSLVEGEDRAAKTVILTFDDEGEIGDYQICHSVIRVDRRMSYTEVQKILDALEADAVSAERVEQTVPQDVLDLLKDLDALAGKLRRRRQEVGSIDLDMPDYDVNIDERGHVVGVTEIVRDRSHGLVEEFMLSANRAVADFMVKRKLPALYRIHEAPLDEDRAAFEEFVSAILGKSIDAADRKALQALLADVAGTHLSDAVNMQLLRSMQRALYSPSVSPHDALHFARYCHFTSPVRRYPDLLVHQVLDRHLLQNAPAAQLRGEWKRKLPGIAKHCNEMQERADEAEREIIKIKLLRYLQDHMGEVFEAVVTGVMEYGVFMRLEDYAVEGLLKVQDIKDDFYRYDEKRGALVGTRTKRRFELGQPQKVTVAHIDMARRRLDLLLED